MTERHANPTTLHDVARSEGKNALDLGMLIELDRPLLGLIILVQWAGLEPLHTRAFPRHRFNLRQRWVGRRRLWPGKASLTHQV